MAKKEKVKKESERQAKTLSGKKVKKAKNVTLDDMFGGDLDVSKIKDVKQLRGASYNPRVITAGRLKDLGNSISSFGDLSGIVFNASKKSQVLISGHQRMKAIDGWKTKLEINPTSDAHGTVGVGYVHAQCPKTKNKVSIPLRIVNWTDRKAEFAANIAANAQGGEFDNKKLSNLIEKLDLTTINPALLGLDPIHLRGLQQRVGEAKTMDNKSGKGTMNGASGAFREVTTEDMEKTVKHSCPRCGYNF